MPISQNYVGKAVDLCVFETSALAGNELVNVGITDSGSSISGPYKVVQKATKFLLTSKGSVPSAPEYGTTFVSLLFSGQIHTNLALEFYFCSEREEVVNYINSSVLTPSLDEQLTDMQLESFSVTLDTATMRIKFSFADSSVILAPVSISTV
jgi:hypothetical protein